MFWLEKLQDNTRPDVLFSLLQQKQLEVKEAVLFIILNTLKGIAYKYWTAITDQT